MKKKLKRKQQTAMRVTGIVMGVFAIAMILSVFGMSLSVREISEKAISKTPDAILASSGITEGKEVSLPVAYFDQKADPCVDLYNPDATATLKKRQFEWSSCGYYNQSIEPGMVDFYLDNNYLPIAKGGKLTPNRGVANFKRWFSAVEGKNQSYSGSLKLEYQKSGAEFSYSSQKFYPLDDAKFSAGDKVNQDGHNHLFTMAFAVPFTALKSGNETFEISADDDTFVFVGNSLAIDMGGIHDVVTGKLTINQNGEIYSAVDNEELAYTGINVPDNESSIIRIFHADRDSANSELSLKFSAMNLNVVETKLADQNGIQIAYDPSDPSYVAPLGESSIFRPDGTKGYMIMAITFGVTTVLFAVLMTMLMHGLVKNKLIAK